MSEAFTINHRNLGRISSITYVVVGWIWGLILIVKSLLSTPVKGNEIDPFLPMITLPVIVLGPLMIICMVAVHAYAPPNLKICSRLSVIFISIAASVTSIANFSAFITGLNIESLSSSWASVFLPYKWPTMSYAIDCLAWDWFFPIAMFLAMPVFKNGYLGKTIRLFMLGSGLFSIVAIVIRPFSSTIGLLFEIVGWGILSTFVFLILAVIFSKAKVE